MHTCQEGSSASTSLGAVVAGNVKALRAAAGLSQDALAMKLQEAGLNWDRNSVAWLETKMREPTLSEFLLLAAALRVKPVEMLRGPDGVEAICLGDEARIAAQLLPGLLSGKGFEWLEPPEWEIAATEAEKVAARRLGLTVEQVQELAWYLWESRLDVERDERAGHPTGTEGSARMRKAHATRKLLVELVDEARGRGWLVDDTQDTKPKRAGKEQER